jgi:hypothetical protein
MPLKPVDPIVQFIRVGVDSGYGGRQSRIFDDRHYHFIPIPKHNDPEWCRFTYGDMASNAKRKPTIKGSSLLRLRRGDFLVFYAGFEDTNRKRCVGVFAYLIVEHAYLFDRSKLPKGRGLSFAKRPHDYSPFKSFEKDANAKTWRKILRRYKKFSQHVESKNCRDEMELLICGDRRRSRLLPKVEILAPSKDGNYIVSSEVARRFGLKNKTDLKRSSVRTEEGEPAKRAIERLKTL